MAFRSLAGRFSGAQVQQGLRAGRQRIRGFSEEGYTGKALSEKEKAAETRFIRKREEEQKLKAAAKGLGDATSTAGTTPSAPSAPSGKPEYPGPTAESGFRNTAVVAGLVAIVAAYWLWPSSPKEEKESS